MPRCGRPSLGGDDAPIAELARELTDQSLGCVAHWCRYECQSCGSTHAHSLWLKDAPHVSFLNKCQESRLEFTTRTGVEDTDGSAETVRSRCARRSACPRASLQAGAGAVVACGESVRHVFSL